MTRNDKNKISIMADVALQDLARQLGCLAQLDDLEAEANSVAEAMVALLRRAMLAKQVSDLNPNSTR